MVTKVKVTNHNQTFHCSIFQWPILCSIICFTTEEYKQNRGFVYYLSVLIQILCSFYFPISSVWCVGETAMCSEINRGKTLFKQKKCKCLSCCSRNTLFCVSSVKTLMTIRCLLIYLREIVMWESKRLGHQLTTCTLLVYKHLLPWKS